MGLSRRAPAVPQPGRHVACDLADAGQTAETIRALAPDVVIHTQALSDVDRCETEPALARRMNVEATANLAQALVAASAGGEPPLLVHISTDYVFEGTKGSAYDETDEPRPISRYGASKLEAERVALRYARSVIVRTSTLFGLGRMNFCDHIVACLREGSPVEAFADQTTSPTYTKDLAEAIEELAFALRAKAPPQFAARMVHLANSGSASRLAFAHRVADLLGDDPGLIRPIRMAEQGRPARRPCCSALTSRYARALIGRTLRSWEAALEAYLHPGR